MASRFDQRMERTEEIAPLVDQPYEWMPRDDSEDEFEETEDDDLHHVETLSWWQLPNWREKIHR